ncbi:MAG: hypothetical protein ACFFHV_23835, partial [Promethearchaeota archaeon]
MRKRYIWILFSAFILINAGFINLINPSFIVLNVDNNSQQKAQDDINAVNEEKTPQSSTGVNYGNIESIFNAKLNQFSSEVYFSQIYESSLQATYFALLIFDAIGKLDTINHAEIVNYIMAHYNETSHIFMDSYAERYLHTDF